MSVSAAVPRCPEPPTVCGLSGASADGSAFQSEALGLPADLLKKATPADHDPASPLANPPHN